MIIQRPMLAAHISTEEELTKLRYPIWAYSKIDGIRVIKNNGLFTRSMKPIKNKWLDSEIYENLPDHIDGEVVVGQSFGDTQSAVTSIWKECDWKVYVFDYLGGKPQDKFCVRRRKLLQFEDTDRMVILPTTVCESPSDVLRFSETQTQYPSNEGVILRDVYGLYKQGRSTLKEQYLVAYKGWEFAEGVVVSIQDKTIHIGEAQVNELGLSQRDSKQENLMSVPEIGSITVYCKELNTYVDLGSGFGEVERRTLYKTIIGKTVRFKYRPSVKSSPRQPIFLEVLNAGN